MAVALSVGRCRHHPQRGVLARGRLGIGTPGYRRRGEPASRASSATTPLSRLTAARAPTTASPSPADRGRAARPLRVVPAPLPDVRAPPRADPPHLERRALGGNRGATPSSDRALTTRLRIRDSARGRRHRPPTSVDPVLGVRCPMPRRRRRRRVAGEHDRVDLVDEAEGRAARSRGYLGPPDLARPTVPAATTAVTPVPAPGHCRRVCRDVGDQATPGGSRPPAGTTAPAQGPDSADGGATASVGAAHTLSRANREEVFYLLAART